ncbi:MAG: hypothetical protein ABF665_02930, partial [Gluconacetobacter sp.]
PPADPTPPRHRDPPPPAPPPLPPGRVGRVRRPIVVVHVTKERPEAVFSWTSYNHKFYWIADDDFDSKLAFTMLQILLELSKTSKGPNTIVTIPANG